MKFENFDAIIHNDGLALLFEIADCKHTYSLKTADPFAYQNIHPVEPPLVDDLPQPIQLRIILFRYLLIDYNCFKSCPEFIIVMSVWYISINLFLASVRVFSIPPIKSVRICNFICKQIHFTTCVWQSNPASNSLETITNR